MNKIQEILNKIGLTKQEITVYIGLLELQEAQTGALCKYTNIASSNIYNILNSLIKKGLVNYKLQNNIKIFMPSSPEILNELFLEKAKKLEQERKEMSEIVSSLKKREIKKEIFSNYKYFEGITGIKSMWHELSSLMNKDSINKSYTTKKDAYKLLLGFYGEHHKIRKEKNIKARMIFPNEDKKLGKERTDELTEIKFMDLQNEAEWGIINNNLYIQYTTSKKPIGFLIQNEKIAKTFEQVFDQLWEK